MIHNYKADCEKTYEVKSKHNPRKPYCTFSIINIRTNRPYVEKEVGFEGVNEVEEACVVMLADAVAKPGTMMIKLEDASITG